MASVQIFDEHSLDHHTAISNAISPLKDFEAGVNVEVTPLSPLSDPESAASTTPSTPTSAKPHSTTSNSHINTSPYPPSSPSHRANHFFTASQILSIIESYGAHDGTWSAFDKFLPIVAAQVAKKEPVQILLPAFPFKSPNTKDIVLGTLPDLGEELALAHLNSIATKIRSIYAPGAEIEICSDGLVYNEFQGVSDATAWTYGEALRSIATRISLTNLKFIRIWDLLEYPLPADISNPERAKTFYLEHARYLRRELDYRYSVPGFDVDYAIANDPDIAATYVSYIDFLRMELPEREDGQSVPGEVVAKRMLARGKAYAAILNAKRACSVRLSIHNSGGKGKLSVPLIPQGGDGVGLMPWRSAVAIGTDGKYRSVYPKDVRETHELVYRDGRPYAFRDKSEGLNWKAVGLDVEFEYLYPSGVVVRLSGLKEDALNRLIGAYASESHVSGSFDASNGRLDSITVQ